MVEEWRIIEYDSRYQVSNYGRFRKKLKNGYRCLKPFRNGNRFEIKIRDKSFICARLVANAFIKRLTKDDRVYHKNTLENDNFIYNLKVISLKELGKLTGPISRSQRVVEVINGEINREWSSARKCAKDLYCSYQTVMDYCNKKVKKPMFSLMWEEDYFEEVLEPFNWENKKKVVK